MPPPILGARRIVTSWWSRSQSIPFHRLRLRAVRPVAVRLSSWTSTSGRGYGACLYGDGRYCYVTTTIVITLYTPSTHHVPQPQVRTNTDVYSYIRDAFLAAVIKMSTFFVAIARPRRLATRASLAPGRSSTTYTGDDKLGVHRRRLAPALPAPPYQLTLIPCASPSRQKLAGLLTGEAAWARTATDHDDTTRRRQVSAHVR